MLHTVLITYILYIQLYNNDNKNNNNNNTKQYICIYIHTMPLSLQDSQTQFPKPSKRAQFLADHVPCSVDWSHLRRIGACAGNPATDWPSRLGRGLQHCICWICKNANFVRMWDIFRPGWLFWYLSYLCWHYRMFVVCCTYIVSSFRHRLGDTAAWQQ